MKCPHCDKPRIKREYLIKGKITKKNMLKTCGDKECESKRRSEASRKNVHKVREYWK